MKTLNTLAFYLFLVLLLISMTLPLNAQPEACQYDIHLSTQAEVDAFAVPFPLNLPGAQAGVLYGSLTVGPLTSNGTTDITNLDGLAGMTQVTGTLLIEENPNLTDISGLSDLTTIGTACPFNELVIQGNPQITSINGLSNLSGYVQRLIIRDMPLVTDIEALSGVTGVGFLWVGGMEAITHVDGLRNMTSLEGLFLTGNTNLLEIDGFSGISGPFVQGQDFIAQNPNLQNLNGLAGVTGTNILTVRLCNALTDLSGLGGLTEVTDQLSINNNAGLLTMDGLNPELTIGGRLTIVGNAQLSDCAIEAVCNHLNMNGSNFITANQAGCANATDVLNNCDSECAEAITETLTSQAEVDAFTTTYGTCRNFLGEIIIDEPQNRGGAAAITNLDALSNLRQINDLRILNAPSLTSLSGLTMLDSINGDLDVRNTAIVNLSSLSNLQKIGGRLDIAFNPVLESVTSFSGVDLIVNNAVIRFNPLLNDLSGFSNLVTVGDVLDIVGNPSLPDLTDFSSLRFSFDGLNINNNDLLTSLAGLETLENINAGLRILNNDLLSDISTLDNLDQATIIATSNGAPGTAALIIRDNPLLSNCAIETVCTFLDGSGTAVDIQGNAVNCESQAVVESNCLALPIALQSFTAQPLEKSVLLTWQTASEENTQNFTLERSTDGGRTFNEIGSVPALDRRDGAEYTYTDNALPPAGGQLYYRLIARDFDGAQEAFGPVAVNIAGEEEKLQVIPNPSSASSSVQILGATAGAELRIMSMDGRLVATLSPSALGVYDLPELLPGVYLIRTSAGKQSGSVARMVVR